MSDRAETGPMQFGDDWPGVFIRGDNAFYFAIHLRDLLESSPDGIQKAVLRGLLNTLEHSDVRTGEPVTKLAEFRRCKP